MSLTKKELELTEKLGNIYNEFINLEEYTLSDNKDFCDGIHVLQMIIMSRSAIRQHPESFKKLITKP